MVAWVMLEAIGLQYIKNEEDIMTSGSSHKYIR